jgi:hypothetical protein
MPSKAESLPAARSKDNQALGFTGDELLEFLVEQNLSERLLPNDVTIGRLAARLKQSGSAASEGTARRILGREIEAGRLVRVPCMNDTGRVEYAYRPKP